jgi:hypothetical protein
LAQQVRDLEGAVWRERIQGCTCCRDLEKEKGWRRRKDCRTAFFWGWCDGERTIRSNGLYELMRRE